MSTRTTWRDVERAATNLADAMIEAGLPVPAGASLAVERGSGTYSRPGTLYWVDAEGTALALAGTPDPAGPATLAQTAAESYTMVTQRAAALRAVAAHNRTSRPE